MGAAVISAVFLLLLHLSGLQIFHVIFQLWLD